MRKICAWCKEDMGTAPSVDSADGVISHGICEECVDRIFAQQRVGIPPLFFDNFGMPVAVVDAERKTN